jgi:Ca2+/Na+ antiporter
MFKKLPGFRSGRRVNNIIASIGYFVFIIVVIALIKAAPTARDSVVDSLAILVLFVCFLIPIANLFKARERFYLLNRSSKKGKITGYIGYTLACLIVFGLINSMESTTAKELRAKQAAENAAKEKIQSEATMAQAKADEQAKTAQEAKAKKEADEKAKAAADAKAKEEADTKAKADAEAKAKAEAEAKAKAKQQQLYQKEVKQFESDLFAKDNKFHSAYKNAQDSLKSGNVYDAYDAFKLARAEASNEQLDVTSINVASDLPDDVKDLLDKTKDGMSTYYYTEKDGIDSMLKFMDDQKPSDASDAKDKFQMAQSFQFDAVAKLTEAKMKVGIK